MRPLVSGARRRIIAELYLDLNSALANPLVAAGIPGRVALDAILIWALVLSNHAQGRKSTAHEIAKTIGIPRPTVNRRLDLLEKLGCVEFEGSRCCAAADAVLSEIQLAAIESIIHRAHEALLRR